MSSPNFINNALTQLFEEIEEKCFVKFNTFTAHDKPQKKGINKDQIYMNQYLQTEDAEPERTYKYLYDPDLKFDFRFHQRMARINYKNREKPWVSLMFNTATVHPLTNVLSHVYDGMEYADFEEIDKLTGETKIVTQGVPYKFRRMLCPVNFVLISNELSYLYQIQEKISMYFDRWINYDYNQTLNFSPLTEKTFHIVGAAQNIRQVHLDKLDTESKGSLCMAAYSFELIYWYIMCPDERYNLLERIILEVHEAKTGKLLFLDICE